jgi:hypothetical protein
MPAAMDDEVLDPSLRDGGLFFERPARSCEDHYRMVRTMWNTRQNLKTHVLRLRDSVNRTCAWLFLAGAWVFLPTALVGCASISGVSTIGHRDLAFQSYDLPASLEANKVIEAVEHSFTRVLSRPPRMTEGSVSSPLPAAAPDFVVEERSVHLDRLGIVNIPTVVCPHSLALLHGFGQTLQKSLPFRYTGCVQFYAGGYRVHFVASAMVANSSEEGQEAEMEDMLWHLGGDFGRQFTQARMVASSREEISAAGEEPAQTDSIHGRVSVEKHEMTAVPSTGEDAGVQNERTAAAALPLVCLAPRASAPIRSQRGAGKIVGMLEPGSVVAVMEPADPSYFWVNTQERHTGWVNQNDVKRLRCPVG